MFHMSIYNKWLRNLNHLRPKNCIFLLEISTKLSPILQLLQGLASHYKIRARSVTLTLLMTLFAFKVYTYTLFGHKLLQNTLNRYHLYVCLNINKIIRHTRVIPAPIHSGEVTHHQDQLITFVSFNTKNMINNISGSDQLILIF